MRKGKFKILTAALLLCFVFGSAVLSGCSLVTTDYAEYYKAVVASATIREGKEIEITKKDLVMAYSSFGYQYSSYYGKSQEEAVKMTIEQLVSNALIVDKVEQYLKEKNDGEVLSKEEKTYLFEKTYDSLISNLKEEEEEKEEEDSETPLKKDLHEKKANLVYDFETDTYSITKTEAVKTTIEKYAFWSKGNKDASTQEGREEIYKLLGDFVSNNSDYAKQFSKYLSGLKASEKGQKLSTANKDVLLREIERLYEVNYETYLITRYEELFKSTKTNVTKEDVLSLYKSYVLEDYATYGIEKSAKYSEDILNSADGMYYNPNEGEFFYVTHILLKFTDEQTKLLEKYNEIIKGNGDGEIEISEAIQEKQKLYDGLLALVREVDENGVYTENEEVSKKEYNADEVLAEVKASVSGSDLTQKAENFYDKMFKFTEDDATLNSTYNYVIGVDYSTPTKDEDGNVTKAYTAHSQMVENFTDAAIALHNHGNGKLGDISGLVESEYGLHILMYGGKVENLCNNISLDMTLGMDTLAKLDNTRINACVDYTYFDMLYESLEKDQFSTYQEQDILLMKSKLSNYNFYENAYKDMIK